MAAKKKSGKKPASANDNINNYLNQREVAKYGPRVIGNEVQYSTGEMSKALRAKMAVDRMTGRTVEFGTRSMLEGMRGWMRGGGGLNTRGK